MNPQPSQQPAHSPLPWQIHRYQNAFLGEKICVVRQGDSRKSMIADIGPTEFSPGRHECEANAAFIVKAVNSHQALVDALKIARDSNRVTWEFFSELNKKEPRTEWKGTLEILDRECEAYNEALRSATQ